MSAPAGEDAAPPVRAATDEVTVVVVDDNAVIRMGLRSLLDAADGVRVVGEAGDGDEALRVIADSAPDVVLLDVRMPRRDGVQVAAEVRGRTRVLMLTYSDAPEVVRAALDAGASGYLVHGRFGADELARSVRVVASGSMVLSPPAADVLRAGPGAAAPPARPERDVHGLSARERDVMELIATGASNGEIARECFLSEKTVKNHVNHIFAKLGVRTRAEAVALWLGGTPGPGGPGQGPGQGMGPGLGPGARRVQHGHP